MIHVASANMEFLNESVQYTETIEWAQISRLRLSAKGLKLIVQIQCLVDFRISVY